MMNFTSLPLTDAVQSIDISHAPLVRKWELAPTAHVNMHYSLSTKKIFVVYEENGVRKYILTGNSIKLETLEKAHIFAQSLYPTFPKQNATGRYHLTLQVRGPVGGMDKPKVEEVDDVPDEKEQAPQTTQNDQLVALAKKNQRNGVDLNMIVGASLSHDVAVVQNYTGNAMQRANVLSQEVFNLSTASIQGATKQTEQRTQILTTARKEQADESIVSKRTALALARQQRARAANGDLDDYLQKTKLINQATHETVVEEGKSIATFGADADAQAREITESLKKQAIDDDNMIANALVKHEKTTGVDTALINSQMTVLTNKGAVFNKLQSAHTEQLKTAALAAQAVEADKRLKAIQTNQASEESLLRIEQQQRTVRAELEEKEKTTAIKVQNLEARELAATQERAAAAKVKIEKEAREKEIHIENLAAQKAAETARLQAQNKLDLKKREQDIAAEGKRLDREDEQSELALLEKELEIARSQHNAELKLQYDRNVGRSYTDLSYPPSIDRKNKRILPGNINIVFR